MRIGLVTQWFPPEIPALASSTMVKGLSARGHEVHVVTGFPNYPHGAVYPGYKIRPYQLESYGEATVHRGPLYPSHDTHPAKRMGNYLSFALGALPTSLRVRQPDVWLTNSTPITASAPGMAHRALLHTPHAQIIQDLWPDSVTGSGFMEGRVNNFVSRILAPACRLSYRLSDSIGVISPGMADVLKERGVPASKLEYVPNGIDDSHLLPSTKPNNELKRSLGLPEDRIFMYAGTFGRLQNLHSLLAAFAKVPEAHLVLVGGGVEEEALKQGAAEVPNIHFVPRQPLDRIGKYIAASDVQIVSLTNSPLLSVTMPSKVQAALAGGRPILSHAPGDAANVVTIAEVGLAADPSDIDLTAGSIRRFLALSDSSIRSMGLRARELYESQYSLEAGAERLENFLIGTIEKNRFRR